MVPLYAARMANLGADDLVQIECACGQVTLLTAPMLATAGVAGEQKLTDLSARLRCPECDARAAPSCRSSGTKTEERCRCATFRCGAEAPACIGAIRISGTRGRRDRSCSSRDCNTPGRAGLDR